VIRLIGLADCADEGGSRHLFQRVAPCLVAVSHPLAGVRGATNAVVAEGNYAGRLLFEGAGAGDGPTASAVVADLIDIARGNTPPPFSLPVAMLEASAPADPGHRRNRAYLRFMVADRPGVLAEITAAMRDAGVSIESLIQQGQEDGEDPVLVAMVTHDGPEGAVAKALALLEGSPSLAEEPLVMRLLG
jgi:homoserine dehydrogenase